MKKNLFLLANLIVIFSIFILPYYLFGNKLYIGGDDTRIFYSYPWDFLKNITFYSWVNNSSIGINGPSQYISTFLVFWGVISIIFKDKTFLNHLALSLPLILGFIYFQKSIKELLQKDKKNNLEIFLGSLFFITSPILIVNQMFVFFNINMVNWINSDCNILFFTVSKDRRL